MAKCLAFIAALCIGVVASTQGAQLSKDTKLEAAVDEIHADDENEADSHHLLDAGTSQTSVAVLANGIVSKRSHAASVIRSDSDFRQSQEVLQNGAAAASSAAISSYGAGGNGGTVKGKIMFSVPHESAKIIASDEAKMSISSICAEAGGIEAKDVVVEISAGAASSHLWQWSLLESTAIPSVSGETALATGTSLHNAAGHKAQEDHGEAIAATFTITVPPATAAESVVSGITDMSHHKFGEELTAAFSKDHLASIGLEVTDVQAAIDVPVKARARTEVVGIGSVALAVVAIASHL